MEKDNDETNNDESSRPNVTQERGKENYRADTTDESTPASSQIQIVKESGGGHKNVPRKERRKCCSHKLRKAGFQDASKASELVDRPDSADLGGQDMVERFQSISEQLIQSAVGGATDMAKHRSGASLDSNSSGFLVQQRSSVSQESSEVELIGQYSVITQESVGQTEQCSDTLTKSNKIELVDEQSPVSEKSDEIELVGNPPDDALQKKSSETDVVQCSDDLKSSSSTGVEGQPPSIKQSESEIKLIEQSSSISSYDSSELGSLVGQFSNITQVSDKTELLDELSSNIPREIGVDAAAEEDSTHSPQPVSCSETRKSLSIPPKRSASATSTKAILNFSMENSDENLFFGARSNSQERKRTRVESRNSQKNSELLPSKKPRLDFEHNQDFVESEESEQNPEEDGISMGVSVKTSEVIELPDGTTVHTSTKPLTPKTKENVKLANATVDRKMKKPKHPKRVPILLETPITEKFTVFMKNDRWKVVGGGMQGWRIRMEDAHITLLETPLDPTVAFFGVFDGHGGNEVSNYVARHLYKFILQSDRFQLGEIDIAIKEGYMNIDNHMRDNDIGKFRQGTTAITIMIKDQTVYCANVGDSRAIAVINGEVVPLSIDQKPTLPEEAKRIGLAGLPILNNRVSGGLAMSRSLGDFRYKSFRHLSSLQQPVIAQPVIVKKSLNDSWEFVVIACDGIWDVMSNDVVAAFVKDKIKNGINLSEICESLFMKCLAPSAFFPNKGCDNMTAVIILLSEELTKSTCLRPTSDKESNQKLTLNG